MKKIKVGVYVGSLRKKAYSKAVADYLLEILPEWMDAEIVEISDLPLYNQDYDDEGTLPKTYSSFREKVGSQQAFLFVTPEHNRSVPAALKNALDVASRPYGHNEWGGKPAAIISTAPGSYGGFGANHHLRQPLMYLDVYTMQQPECYLGHIDSCVDESGAISREKTREILADFVKSFSEWVEIFVRHEQE